MRTAEQMNVILVRPNRFHLNRKPFRNLAAVSWMIVVTASSSSAFRYFTGKTMW